MHTLLRQKSSEGGKPSRNIPISRNDCILIFGLLLLAASFGIFYALTHSAGAYVAVSVDGEPFGSYPLHQNDVVEIRTDGMENILVIEDGKAFVRSASCPNGICCAHRPIFREGETIVCYPHKVVITVCAEP